MRTRRVSRPGYSWEVYDVKRLAAALFMTAVGVAISASAFAQGTGRSLDIQPGARQNGLGAAGVALHDDAAGVTWWNAAGLGFTTKPMVDLTYAQLVPGLATDVSYNYLSYAQPVEGWGAFGLGIVFLSYGESEGIDINNNPTGKFGSNEFSPAVFYGTRVLPDLSVGASLKYIRIQLAPNDMHGIGSTFGLDLGAQYQIPAARLTLGANLQNLGPSVTFINEDESSPLSRSLRVGGAWDAYKSQQFGVLLVGDYYQSLVTSDWRTYNGGVELRLADQLSGRIGYYDDPLGQISDLTFGLGINWKGLTLDFGSIPQAKDSGLDNVKKITLGYHF